MSHNFFGGAAAQYIDVGGEQFHALAVALIDSIKHSTRVNDASLKKILEYYYRLYPKSVPLSNKSYLTPLEGVGKLINSARKSEIVACMGIVLQQLIIDEIYASPLKYRELFDGFDKSTPKKILRQPKMQFPASIICAALSEAITITITLSFVEQNKELRKCEIYTNNSVQAPKLGMRMQVQGAYYFPEVKNRADYAYVGQLAVKPPTPIQDLVEESETLESTIELLATDNQRLLRTFIQWRQNLLTMVQLGELTTANLLDLYITFLPLQTGYLREPTQFFAKLTQTTASLVETKELTGSLLGNNKLYANSLAAWISAGLVDSEELSDGIEKLFLPSVSPIG